MAAVATDYSYNRYTLRRGDPAAYRSTRQDEWIQFSRNEYVRQRVYLNDITIRSIRYAHSSKVQHTKLPLLSSILMAIGSMIMIITGFIFLKPINAALVAVMGTLVFILIGLVLTVKMLDRNS